MATLSREAAAKAVRDYQAQCNGTDQCYRHLGGMIYTDGMRVVAEACGAYWLLDVVASYQPLIRKKFRDDAGFQVWRVARHGKWHGGVEVSAWSDTPDDRDSKCFVRQEVEISDFPAELMPFEFYVEETTCLLKEEH